MRCEECEKKGYVYCFLYPHSVPKVEIVTETRLVPVTVCRLEGIRW